MERITKPDGKYTSPANIKLKAYEDTGLDPNDILNARDLVKIACALCELDHYKKLGDINRLQEALQKQSEYEEFMERWKDAVALAGAVKEVGADRVAELVEADKAGRCAILSEPMMPMIWKPGDTDVYCPNCGNTLSGGWPLSDTDETRKLCQCPNCGQSIDDTKAESALDKMTEE